MRTHRSAWVSPFLILFLTALLTGGQDYSKPPPTSAQLSAGEIVAAVPRDFPPYYSVDKNGEAAGFAVEVFDRIAALAGFTVRYHVYSTSAEAQNAIVRGEAQVIPNMGIAEKRNAFLEFAVPMDEFNVSVLTLKNRTDIDSLSDLVGQKTAVVATNVAADHLKNRDGYTLVTFDAAPRALEALLNGDVDALAFPEPVIRNLARDRGVLNDLKLVGQPLVTVRRAVAVSRSSPGLHAPLNEAAAAFLSSPDYTALYSKYFFEDQGTPTLMEGLAKASLSSVIVPALSTLALLFLVARLFADRASRRTIGHRIRFNLTLLNTISAGAVILLTGSITLILFQVSMKAQEMRLSDTAQTVASLIEATSRYAHSSGDPAGADTAILSIIRDALSRRSGEAEVVLAHIKDQSIVFDLRQHSWERSYPATVDRSSTLAEPMRRALQGQAGTAIVTDYRGEQVLAAYRPLPSLGMGLVVKIDTSRLHTAFLVAGAAAGIIALAAVLGFHWTFRGINRALIQDIYEQTERLRHSEKMTAVGNFAEGIAHDLKNLLLPILSLTRMVLNNQPEDSRDKLRLEKVVQAADRANDLIKKINGFAHVGASGEEPINVYQTTVEALEILQETMPASIKISSNLDRLAGRSAINAATLQTALLNLASNARDALEGNVGAIKIELAKITLEHQEAAELGLANSGHYARISVQDNGPGIHPATMKKIFDPYFTTKGVGTGTGLGLAMVKKSVEEAKGGISVVSSPHQGTTFSLFLPVYTEAEPERVLQWIEGG